MKKKLPCIPLLYLSLSLSLSLSLCFSVHIQRRSCWQIFLKQKSWWFCHILNLHFSSLASAQPSKGKKDWGGGGGDQWDHPHHHLPLLERRQEMVDFSWGFVWGCDHVAVMPSPAAPVGPPVSPLLLSSPP